MLKLLMVVSGCVEVLFGLSALSAPLAMLEILGETGADATVLAFTRLLGAATLGLGIGALLARNHLEEAGGLAAAYGLALYNVVGAGVLIFAVLVAGAGGTVLVGGTVLHTVIALLFIYALAVRA